MKLSYRIAVASSGNGQSYRHFGETDVFQIYEVEDMSWKLIETRHIKQPEPSECGWKEQRRGIGCGCGGDPRIKSKAEQISDCRCVVCAKAGMQMQKELERKGITCFEVDCSLDRAMERIIGYYERVDNHISLRGFAGKEQNI